MPFKVSLSSSLTVVILVLFGAVFLVISGSAFYTDWRFARDARGVQGTVIGKDVRTTTSRRRGSGVRSRTEHYDVRYRFSVDGAAIEGRDELTKDAWDRVHQSGEIGVLYLPGHPSSNRLEGSRSWATQAIFGLMGLAFTAAGIGASLRTIRRRRQEAQSGLSTGR